MKKTLLIFIFVFSIFLFTGCKGNENQLSDFDKLVEELPEIVTLDDENIIVELREKYDNLSKEEKEKVKLYDRFESLENQIISLKLEEVNKVDEICLSLPDVVTLDHEDAINNARILYDKLSDFYKTKVKNLNLLLDRETQLFALKTTIKISEIEYAHVDEIINLSVNLSPNITDVKLEFSSSDTEVATVDEHGVVTFLSKGNVSITAKVSEYLFDTIDITVFENVQTEAIKYIENRYNGIDVDKDIELIKEYKGHEIIWYMSNVENLDDNGKYNAPILDITSSTFCVIIVNNEEHYTIIEFNIKGSGKVIDVIEKDVLKIIPSTINSHILLPTSHSQYGGKITWESTNEEVFTSSGIFTRLDDSTEFAVKYRIEHEGEIIEGIINTVALGKTDLQKATEVINDIDLLYKDITEVNEDLKLVTSHNKFNPVITWKSDSESIISSNGKYTTPLYDQKVTVFLTVTVNESSVTKTYTVNVKGLQYEDKWEAVDVFLKNIYKETVENQRFTLYGSEPGYEYVPALNKGYIPFYNNNDSEIKVDLLDKISNDKKYIVNNSGTAIAPNIEKDSTNFIVIHNTGMAAPTATAERLNYVIHNTDRQASWHYSVDDKDIYQHLPNDNVAWHAGDGTTSYGSTWVAKDGKTYIGGGNYNGIGIEMCVYAGIDFNMAMRNTAKLTAELLLQYELTFDAIKQHYDFAGKDCPQVIRQANRMEEFFNLVRIEYFAKTHLKDVKFTFQSLSPEIMDDKGNVFNHPGVETMISYKVIAEYNGEVKDFTFTSTLAALK